MPPPAFPEPDIMSQVIGDAIAVAIVAFAISVSMAQLFAKKHNYEVDSNQELLAEGATNMVCANLNCYMMCVSLSRSVVCENLGCKSQLNALFSGGLMLLVILFIASYFSALPSVRRREYEGKGVRKTKLMYTNFHRRAHIMKARWLNHLCYIHG